MWKQIERPVIVRAANKRGYDVTRMEIDETGEMGEVTYPHVISVTTALKTAYPPYLAWWAQKIGVEGTLELGRLGLIESWNMPSAEIVPLLTENKLTVNHVRDAAADRGTNVHKILEAFGQTGEAPDLADHPEEQHHFISKLADWLLTFRPRFHEQETATAYIGQGYLRYAGTFDGYATMTAGPLEGWTGLIDLKTSKGVYLDHHVQLAAYQYAESVLGMPPMPAALVHIPSDPESEDEWQFVRGCATPDNWLLALDFALSTRDLEKQVKKEMQLAVRPGALR